MKVITIEERAYKTILSKLDSIDRHFKMANAALEAKNSSDDKEQTTHRQIITERKAEEVYLDGKEVCELLRISSRTLLRLRKDGQLVYMKLRGKCIYKLSHIKDSLDRKVIVNDPLTMEHFVRKYNQLIGRNEQI